MKQAMAGSRERRFLAFAVFGVKMSGYAGTGRATLLRANRQVRLFDRENNITGRASMAIQLERISRSFYPWGTSLEIYFTDMNGNPSDPGAFEIDIQTSDIDQDAMYVTLNAYTGTLNGSFVGRVELTSFWAKYVRVFLKTLTNAVYTSVLVTR